MMIDIANAKNIDVKRLAAYCLKIVSYNESKRISSVSETIFKKGAAGLEAGSISLDEACALLSMGDGKGQCIYQ